MNSTNATNPAVEAEAVFELETVVYFHEMWITGLVSVSQLALFVIILYRSEAKTWKTIMTPLNMLLIIMIVSNCLNLTCYYFSGQVQDYVPLSIVNIIMTTSFLIAVFIYNYYRVFPIINTYFPRTLPVLKLIIFVLIPSLEITQNLLNILSFIVSDYFTVLLPIVNVLFILVAALAFLFEVFVAVCYIVHQFAEPAKSPLGGAFQIIAKFGIGSSILTFLWQASSIISLNGEWSLTVWLSLQSFYILAPLVFTSLQLWMKWEILKARVERQKSGISAKLPEPSNTTTAANGPATTKKISPVDE
ncbi:hypothetical protein BC830DRAFT_390557 [Chytriomyces sp. MP71]|nr:hypothetical protein BC830DRAFT_390557 [Chytriomyces sp. MP71]